MIITEEKEQSPERGENGQSDRKKHLGENATNQRSASVKIKNLEYSMSPLNRRIRLYRGK